MEHGFNATITQGLPCLRRNEYVSRRNPLKKLLYLYQNILGRPTIHRYEDVLLENLPDKNTLPNNYPCLIPNWDNTPRSGSNGLVLHGSTPELFRTQVKKSLQIMENTVPEHKIIFIKSWNEWAEGNHLEPDLKYGRAYLDVIRNEVM